MWWRIGYACGWMLSVVSPVTDPLLIYGKKVCNRVGESKTFRAGALALLVIAGFFPVLLGVLAGAAVAGSGIPVSVYLWYTEQELYVGVEDEGNLALGRPKECWYFTPFRFMIHQVKPGTLCSTFVSSPKRAISKRYNEKTGQIENIAPYVPVSTVISRVYNSETGGIEAKHSPLPSIGAVEGGYRFRGGDPFNPSNWERVLSSPTRTLHPGDTAEHILAEAKQAIAEGRDPAWVRQRLQEYGVTPDF